jgi:crossover junction endodeoxyribonuclease RuvC
LTLAAQTRLPVFEYAPAKVKRAVGAGGADGKDAVARMVHTFLRVAVLERADASDALAVAICHLNQARAAAGTAPGRRRSWASLAERLTPAYQRAGATR